MADEEVFEYGEEPGSPATRLFHTKKMGCYIITLMGLNIKVDVEVFKKHSAQYLPNIPRFSSLMVKDEKNGKTTWVPTTINIEDHVLFPNLEYDDQENPFLGDKKVDEYIANMSSKQMDLGKPLWELHILNVKTSSANSTAVFWIHHSVGDGISLCPLDLDPENIRPEKLSHNSDHRVSKNVKGGDNICGRIKGVFSKIWVVLLVIFYTCYDVSLFLAILFFLKDTETPIKGGPGVEKTRKSVLHRDISLDDLKLLKIATNSTINDAIVGVTQAGLSRYLNRKYANHNNKYHGEKNNNKIWPEKMRVTTSIIFNLRPIGGLQVVNDMMRKKSQAKWGNLIGYSFLPLTIAPKDDPLASISEAQAITKRKKLSLESRFSYAACNLCIKLIGIKFAAWLTHRVLTNTTIMLSNVVGPREEVSFFEHPLAFIAPSVHGLPFALTIHYQSYMNKMTIVFTYDPLVIPDPHQLFDDIQDSVQDIKNAATRRGILGNKS